MGARNRARRKTLLKIPFMALPFVRVGIGYDAHSLKPGRKLIIGGVEIPYDRGLDGHSDADVLLHAITDSLLGAAGLGDMGKFFPSGDERFRDVSSIRLLQESVRMVSRQGFEIGNVDSVVVAEEPKLASYLEGMRSNIGFALVRQGEIDRRVGIFGPERGDRGVRGLDPDPAEARLLNRRVTTFRFEKLSH